MNLHINKVEVETNLRNMAAQYGVTESQLAAFIFRNFYHSLRRMRISAKIRRFSVAITNLSEEL